MVTFQPKADLILPFRRPGGWSKVTQSLRMTNYFLKWNLPRQYKVTHAPLGEKGLFP